ncbi:MAG: CehA/McbA family metallohydrolase [Vicinamibacterales bacterium]
MTLGNCRSASVGLFLSAVAVWLIAGDRPLEAHGSEARYVEVVPWQKERFSRVLAVSRSELGTPGTRRTAEVRSIGGRSCIVGAVFAFDVDDRYAFDIDEPVTLTLTYASEETTPFVVGWDRNGGEGFGVTDELTPQRGDMFASVTLTLDRARFSGRGVQRTDLAVSGRGGIALCDVAIERTGTTQAPTQFGRLVLDVRDGNGGPFVPARVGLYDTTGRAPLPSDRALSIHRFADEIRLLRVNARTFWPSANRLAFYTDGSYETRLPIGTYELVVTRGPEYRSHRSMVEIRRDETTTLTVPMQRYADLPGRGWFSGDSHIHLMRDQAVDTAVWGQIAAEDLYVGNLLEMGNIAGTHFKQPAWGQAGRFERDGRVLVSGQEDPRTGQRGHTMHWNIQRPVHLPDAFFKYHEIFENTRRQGGLTGYAHLGELFNGRRGLALDVPFGLVDFIEVLQGGRLNSEIWYTFLNLGYRVLPVAGADFPYFGPTLPGVERTYVKLDGPFSADAWFSAFRDGHVYVTNGPFLELAVNGQQMGDELHVTRGAPLHIEASARLNPEFDQLERLELVVLGDVAATERADGADDVELSHELAAGHSMWIAVRAWGQRQEPRDMTVAHSAPIFVVVDDEPTWKREAVPELIAYQRAQLRELLSASIDPQQDLETWETGATLVERWRQQRSQLVPRVDEADLRYQNLLERFQRSAADGNVDLP